MEQIQNDLLIEAYEKALDLELEAEFLLLLYQELKGRQLHHCVLSPEEALMKIC
ncbi:sporulation histidine kinase inhibitor Sda [Bacillus sp. FJAT-45037]|uniref:sporulation histidine kinase inhibitor Sda n=1 Tax=Bacillus sp. FJAT-45037 TaxID=2011007 RepID=UPI000C23DC02|nr:sporulation histidine kinase inhibitor Sda [Bacillus sp. FJAT-45037]